MYLRAIMAIARSRLAKPGSSLFSVTTLAKKSSPMTSSLRSCSKVMPNTSFCSSFLGS